MPNESPSQTSFNAGILSDHIAARTDIPKYGAGCSVLENFLPEVEGPATRRPGNKFIAPQGDEDTKARLVPFEFSITENYQLEFGNRYMRVFRNQELILDSSHTPADVLGTLAKNELELDASKVGLNTGDSVYITGTNLPEINGQFFRITVSVAGIVLDGVDGTTFPDQAVTAGTIQLVYKIATPYDSDQVFAMQFAQSADVMYFAHRDVPRQKLTRLGDDDWTFAEVPSFGTVFLETNDENLLDGMGNELWPPFLPIIKQQTGLWFEFVNRVYAGDTGVRLISDTASTFTANDVGRYIVLQSSDNSLEAGFCEVTSYVSGTEVLVTCHAAVPNDLNVMRPQGDICSGGDVTRFWAWSAFDHVSGYPQAVSLYDNRLYWASTVGKPQTIWISGFSDFENHRPHEATFLRNTTVPDLTEGPRYSIEPDSAMTITLNSEKLDAIEWIRGIDVLFLGTRAGEWTLKRVDPDIIISPGNIRVDPVGRIGSRAGLVPIIVDTIILFVQRAGRKLKELVFNQQTQTYVAPDMTRIAREVTNGRIISLGYQQEPNRVVWAAMEDGTFASFTYERLDAVAAWAQNPLGGSGSAESVSVSPSSTNDSDEVWLSTMRTVNGQTRRFIEVMQEFWEEGDVLEDSLFVDAGVKYDGSPATVFYGLMHLIGETIEVLADGAAVGAYVVDVHGRVTLDEAASKVSIGLPYTSKLRTMRFEAGARDGTAQGKTKRIQRLVVRFFQTGPGVMYGPDFDDLKEIQFRGAQDDMDTPVPLFDGDTVSVAFPGGHNQEGYVAIEQSKPLPCTVVGLYPQLETHDRG